MDSIELSIKFLFLRFEYDEWILIFLIFALRFYLRNFRERL